MGENPGGVRLQGFNGLKELRMFCFLNPEPTKWTRTGWLHAVGMCGDS